MDTSYTPVAYEYREAIQQAMAKAVNGKIFYFNSQDKVDDASGVITRYEEIPGKGWFIVVNDNIPIRIDRIITLFGKPAAACDEFYALGDVCLECTGGYPLD
jgi:hypothetical protein